MIQKSLLPKSYRRNLDLMKLLVSDKKFQAEVIEARKILKTPTDSWLGKDEQDFKNWNRWILAKTDKILRSKKFNSAEKLVNKKLRKKGVLHSKYRKEIKALYDSLPSNYINTIGEKLASKFGVPKHFDKYIRGYIVLNKVDAPRYNFGSGMYEAWQLPSSAGYVPINIYSQLTKDEFNDLKKQIDIWTKQKFVKPKAIPKLDQYLQTEELWKNRIMDNVYGYEKYIRKAADIAEEIFEDQGKTNKVNDQVRKIHNLRKSRLKPKPYGTK